MTIIYNENPLATQVILDEYEKKELWFKIKIQELQDSLGVTRLYLKEGKYFSIEKARERVNEIAPEDTLDKRVDNIVEIYIEELQKNHCGDCTCFAATCEKCCAEHLLGINTIPGLSKYSAHAISGKFTKGIGIDQVIEELANYILSATWEHWEKWAPKWKEDAQKAHDWLVNYKKEFLNMQV
jgi:hypothetical protein